MIKIIKIWVKKNIITDMECKIFISLYKDNIFIDLFKNKQPCIALISETFLLMKMCYILKVIRHIKQDIIEKLMTVQY